MFLIAQFCSNISYLCVWVCICFEVFLSVMVIERDFLFSIDLL